MVQARLRILACLMAFPFCVALVRLAVLQLVPSFHDPALLESRHLGIRPIAPERGRILARGGEVLAGNIPVYDIELIYSQLNPRDRLVEILADELGERFSGFHRREAIEAKILELARPEELATPPQPPDVIKPLELETEGESSEASDGKEWIFLIGSIHPAAKRRIAARWRKSGIPFHQRSYLEFRDGARTGYFDLWFSRGDILRQEIVLLRLARMLANGDTSRLPAEYDRLIQRARAVRDRFENLVQRDVGPPPARSSPPVRAGAHADAEWKEKADLTRSQYHSGHRAVLVEDVTVEAVSAVEYYPESFAGLSSRSRSRRVYPEKEVCGSLLGHLSLLDAARVKQLRDADLLVDEYFERHQDLEGFDQVRSGLRSAGDHYGAGGLESSYDAELRGSYGAVEIQFDRRRNRREVLGECPSADGADITTTIDLPLQRLLHEELTRASGGTSLLGGNAASAVVMDVSTGELIACAGVPSLDPNRVRDPDYHAELEERWGGQTRSWLWDRPTRYPLAPGSIFKIVLAAAALETAAETGFSPRATAYPCQHQFPHFKVHCSATYGHGLEKVDLVQALKLSCNNYFFSVGYLLLTPQRIEPWARNLGYGRSPGIDLGGGGQKGRLDDAVDIHDVGVCYYSIGQVHVEATPLQVARSLSVIASGGELPRPYLVKPTGPSETVTFSNPETIKVINDGLWRAAHEPGGTVAGPELGLNAFRVALKTGTAEVSRAGEKLNHAWLAGYAPAGPAGEPRVEARIAFAVVIEETRGHGAEVGAPIVRRLLEHLASSAPEAYRLDATLTQAAGK